MHVHNLLGLVLIAVIALGVAAVLFAPGRKAWLAHLVPKSLLTPNEIEFFQRLQRALPTYYVFPQIPFAAMITIDDKVPGKARQSMRARFDRKIADFVVCERGSFKILALVELDDRTHNRRDDRQRDAITKVAGYTTLRFQSKLKPTEVQIAAALRAAIAPTENGRGRTGW